MKWYYSIAGGHTHVRVFMNGGKCGDLCFRNGEFEQVKSSLQSQSIIITFIDETGRPASFLGHTISSTPKSDSLASLPGADRKGGENQTK